jgi:hypothetical protein
MAVIVYQTALAIGKEFFSTRCFSSYGRLFSSGAILRPFQGTPQFVMFIKEVVCQRIPVSSLGHKASFCS